MLSYRDEPAGLRGTMTEEQCDPKQKSGGQRLIAQTSTIQPQRSRSIGLGRFDNWFEAAAKRSTAHGKGINALPVLTGARDDGRDGAHYQKLAEATKRGRRELRRISRLAIVDGSVVRLLTLVWWTVMLSWTGSRI